MYPNKFCFENGYIWYFRYAGNSSLSNSFVVVGNPILRCMHFRQKASGINVITISRFLQRRSIYVCNKKLSKISFQPRPCPFLRLLMQWFSTFLSSHDNKTKNCAINFVQLLFLEVIFKIIKILFLL